MVIIKASLRDYFLYTHWGILMENFLALMKEPLDRA